MTFKDKTKEFVLKVANEKAFANLETYVNMIEEKNKVMNLTGFSGDRLWKEGIFESIISLYQFFGNPGSKKLLDIGAGAGFPSVPFKIVFPEVNLTIIEPLNKRMIFLEGVFKKLGLEVKLLIARAEEVKDETFDLVTARAVAPLKVLLEISSQLGHKETHYAFLKGPSVVEELDEAKAIINKLKITGSIKKIESNDLDREAYAFEYQKQFDTPNGYPRPWAKIVAEK